MLVSALLNVSWSTFHLSGSEVPGASSRDGVLDHTKILVAGNSLVVQWLGLWAFAAKDLHSIPGWVTKVLQAVWWSIYILLWNVTFFIGLLDGLILSHLLRPPDQRAGLPPVRQAGIQFSLKTPRLLYWTFQEALVVKNTFANAGDTRDVGLIPGLERSPGRKWQPTPVFLPGKPHGHRSPGATVRRAQRVGWGWACAQAVARDRTHSLRSVCSKPC